VHLELNHHAMVSGERAAFRECLANLLERLLLGHALRKPVGPDLHARRPDVLRQLHPLSGLIDVLADDGRVDGLELAGRAKAANPDRRRLELLPHFGARSRRQRNLHSMPVRRPQLDPIESEVGQVLDDRRDVPVLRDVVGDRTELETTSKRRRPRRLLLLDGGGKGQHRDARQKGASIHARELTAAEPAGASIKGEGSAVSAAGARAQKSTQALADASKLCTKRFHRSRRMRQWNTAA
jgi:hypothetical protein